MPDTMGAQNLQKSTFVLTEDSLRDLGLTPNTALVTKNLRLDYPAPRVKPNPMFLRRGKQVK